MLDRGVVQEFLDDQLGDIEIEVPKYIRQDVLVETFCKYVEDDYYEWLKDNFKSFFNHGDPDWDWVKNRIKHYSKDQLVEFSNPEQLQKQTQMVVIP